MPQTTETIACPRCNTVIAADYLICPQCSFEIRRQPGGRRQNVNIGRWAVAALVWGILGVVVQVIPFILPGLALHYGNRVRRIVGNGSGMATAGWVLGWIGLAFNVLFVIRIMMPN